MVSGIKVVGQHLLTYLYNILVLYLETYKIYIRSNTIIETLLRCPQQLFYVYI